MRSNSGGGSHPEARKRRNTLGAVVVLATLLALGLGCGVQGARQGRGHDFTGEFRWAGADTSRLLRNARYFKLMGQPELGIKELEEAYRQDPGNLKLADALAQYYDESGLGARAQQIYLEALARAPDNPALQNNLCFSYYQAGNLDQAEACYRQTLARQPDNQAARNNLGLVLCRQGRQAEARQLWQAAEGEAAAARKLAEALAALGMGGEPRYARQTLPRPEGQSGGGQAAPAEPPVTAAAVQPPAPAASPAVGHRTETAARPEAPPPAAAAVKLAATLPAKPGAAESKPREWREPETVAAPAPPAALPSPQPAPELAAAHQPARSLQPQGELAQVPPPQSHRRVTATPAESGQAASQAGRAGQPGPQAAAGSPSPKPSRAKSPAHITVRELLDTNIAILNGNGVQDLARETRSKLHLEGYGAVAINNFRDFGVDRTVIYFRPEAERVAASLSQKFFPGAELMPEPRLADSIDVKVVLGHDLGGRHQAGAPPVHGPRL